MNTENKTSKSAGYVSREMAQPVQERKKCFKKKKKMFLYEFKYSSVTQK